MEVIPVKVTISTPDVHDQHMRGPADRHLVSVTVDLVIFTMRRDDLHVLLITRATEPFRGLPALPGGYVRESEPLDQAALRKLGQETGVDGTRLHLEQLRTYGAPGRDPRGRVITVAYLALGPNLADPPPEVPTQDAHWAPVREVLDGRRGGLAFDHSAILREALEKARSQLEYTTVATAFCAEPFSVADLRRIYESAWGLALDPSNFRRKVTRAENFIEPTGEFRGSEVGRPAALYRRGTAQLLYPPILRSGAVARAQFTSSTLR
jgi:ADP-ribose pyrophosphatase YjhB (NUDIX family)